MITHLTRVGVGSTVFQELCVSSGLCLKARTNIPEEKQTNKDKPKQNKTKLFLSSLIFQAFLLEAIIPGRKQYNIHLPSALTLGGFLRAHLTGLLPRLSEVLDNGWHVKSAQQVIGTIRMLPLCFYTQD